MARSGSVFLCIAFSVLATPIMGKTYIVGDLDGWALGIDYDTWASTKTFKVGDSLVFNYGSSHSVAEVSSSEYTSCSLTNPLSADRSGASTITLKTTGQHYFVCGVSGHCVGGQKLAVTVSSDDSAIAVPPSGSIDGPETSAPTSPENNDVQNSSSATSLSPIIATIFFMAFGVVVSKLFV